MDDIQIEIPSGVDYVSAWFPIPTDVSTVTPTFSLNFRTRKLGTTTVNPSPTVSFEVRHGEVRFKIPKVDNDKWALRKSFFELNLTNLGIATRIAQGLVLVDIQTTGQPIKQQVVNTGITESAAVIIKESHIYLSDLGVTGDVAQNATTLFNQAISIAADENKILMGRTGATYLVDYLEILNTGKVPVGLEMMHSRIQCSGVNPHPEGNLIWIQNPHGLRQHFFLRHCTIDGDNKVDYPLKLHGGTDVNLECLLIRGAEQDGLTLDAEPNYGIYSCNFTNIVSVYNKGRGVVSTTRNGAGAFHNASNSFNNVRCLHNLSDGWFFDYAGGTINNGRSERNNGYGLNLDNIQGLLWSGGYFEHNHENMAQGGAKDATGDELALMTAMTSGYYGLGYRDIGDHDWSAISVLNNKNFVATKNSGSISLSPSGDLEVGSARVAATGGFAAGTGTMVGNSLILNDQGTLRAGGKTIARINTSDVEGKSNMTWRHLKGGTPVVRADYLEEPAKQESDQDYTIQVADFTHNMIELTHAGVKTLVIPDSGVTPMPLNRFLTWRHEGTGALTVTKNGAGDTLVHGPDEGLTSPGQGAVMMAYQISLGNWQIIGGKTP